MPIHVVTLRRPRVLRARPRPLPGRFLERPHRFMARVELDGGARVEAHLANPGRLTGTLSPRCRLLLDGPFPPPRSLPYTVVAARERGVWVGTVTTYANALFPVLLRRGLLPELLPTRCSRRTDGQNRSSPLPGGGDAGASRSLDLAAEVTHGRSRFDFRVGATLVEVKSVTLRDGSDNDNAGLFPDAVSARATRHLTELTRLVRRGGSGAVLFLAQRGDVTEIAPATAIDPAFTEALRRADAAGVMLLGAAVAIAPLGASRAWRVPVRVP